MKKQLALLLALLCIFALGGCAQTPPPVLLDRETGEVSVLHTLSGQTAAYTLSGEALEALRSWLSGLRLKRRSFAEGQTPGDSDGGEVYAFEAQGAGESFSYVVNGTQDCYLLAGGEWYAVENPVAPPFETPDAQG